MSSLRPLQGKQGAAVEQRFHFAGSAQVPDQMRQVLLLATGVDHQKQVLPGIGHHQVVEDATVFIGEHGIALHTHGQVDDVHRHQCFQGPGRTRTVQADLAHVRYVEQARLFAGVLMLFHHAQRILHRHFVAGKRHQAGAKLQVQNVQRGFQQLFVRHG